jgi:hypothetical protein
MSYSEKLKNPEWQKKRLEVLNRDNLTCQLCFDEKTELHVHHKKYIKGKEPWDIPTSNLQTLCKHCHGLIEWHKQHPEFSISTVAYKDTAAADTYLFIAASISEGEEDGLIIGKVTEGIFRFLLWIPSGAVRDIHHVVNANSLG